jgi:hypothetical protein
LRLRTFLSSTLLTLNLFVYAQAQNYPDQYFVLKGDSLLQSIDTVEGLTSVNDGTGFVLRPDRTDGFVIFKPQFSHSPFNRGFPSWNGSAPDSNSSFKIQMRFPDGTGWSAWLTVGYWKAHLWATYGATQFTGGDIDIDNVKLSSYASSWQFKVAMTRATLDQESPTLRKLGFFVCDTRTTASQDFSQILNDNPAANFIPTNFIYQYGVDPQIGGSICSPSSVAMILRSYGIPVDPLQFARDTYDPYFHMFGIWPRVVQNASEYGLDGAVTCYRSWSQAGQVLRDGGRISMSVGPPLYAGHLIMLAGFTAAGDPIVHDPSRSDGYAHVFSKSDLSHSWFDKGGIAYTFHLAGAGPASVDRQSQHDLSAAGFNLSQNFPNPFNPTTVVSYQLPVASTVRLSVFDMLGRVVAVLENEKKAPGRYQVKFDGSGLASGVYLYRIEAGSFVQTKRLLLLR